MSLLSAADLTSMRGVLNDSLPDSAVIQSRTYTSDSGGGGTATWTAGGTVACRIAPVSGDERAIGGRLSPDAKWIVTLPANTSVSEDQRLVISGTTYEVEAVRGPRSFEPGGGERGHMSITTNRFPKIIATLGPTVGGAVRAGGELVEQRAKGRVAVDEGDLRDAIHTERDGVAGVRVVAGNANVFYGHLVEHGTAHHAAQPFLIPALEESRAEVLGLVTAALRRL
jgi:HK97 gp10 family phage protein/SPP1 family predicted phage head-tail adaptor